MMKRKKEIYSKILITSLLAFVFSSVSLAQNKTYNEEITVVAPFDPIIPDAFKISRNPAINDTLAMVPSMTYTIVPRVADLHPAIEQMPAVKLIAEPLSKLYRNYIRAGAGNYSSLYGELFMSSLRSKQFVTSLRLKHQSSAGKIKDYGPPANNHTEAGFNASKYFGEHTLNAKLFFNRDVFHLYGYKPTEWMFEISKDDVRQRFYTIGTTASFGSNYKSTEKLNHTVGITFYHMGALNNVAENNVHLSLAADKKYDLLKIGPPQSLGVKLETDFLNQHDANGHINSGVVILNPFLKGNYDEYSYLGGVKIGLSRDTATKAHLYPVLEGRIELIPNALKLYAGLNGSLERTSLKSITAENAFISPVVAWNYINEKLRAYGGFQSNISRVFNLEGSISSSTFEDYPFFVNDTSSLCNNSFTVLYDDMTAVTVKGALEFVKSTKLRVGLTGAYNHYKMIEQQHAWYKPAFVFEFSGRYDLGNKIIVNAKATVNGPVWAKIPQAGPLIEGQKPYFLFDVQKLKGFTDVSLGAEYRFNNAFSCWLNLNNLTNSTYYRWYNYRSYGFNVLAGVSYSF